MTKTIKDSLISQLSRHFNKPCLLKATLRKQFRGEKGQIISEEFNCFVALGAKYVNKTLIRTNFRTISLYI